MSNNTQKTNWFKNFLFDPIEDSDSDDNNYINMNVKNNLSNSSKSQNINNETEYAYTEIEDKIIIWEGPFNDESSFCKKVIDNLKSNQKQIINFKDTSQEIKQNIKCIIYGATTALNGSILDDDNQAYTIVVPQNVSISKNNLDTKKENIFPLILHYDK